MTRYLVDANLSSRISVWRSDHFEFVADLNDEWTDTEVWNYARSHNLTILTKDSDFAHRIILVDPPPKIVHFRIGNMRLSEYVAFIERHWETIQKYSFEFKLVIVFRDRIEVVR